MTQKYIRVKDASEYSSMPPGTIYYYIHQGVLPSYKVRGRRLLNKTEFDKFIESGGNGGSKKTW